MALEPELPLRAPSSRGWVCSLLHPVACHLLHADPSVGYDVSHLPALNCHLPAVPMPAGPWGRRVCHRVWTLPPARAILSAVGSTGGPVPELAPPSFVCACRHAGCWGRPRTHCGTAPVCGGLSLCLRAWPRRPCSERRAGSSCGPSAPRLSRPQETFGQSS